MATEAAKTPQIGEGTPPCLRCGEVAGVLFCDCNPKKADQPITEMYRVSYSGFDPRISKRKVTKVTAKTVTFVSEWVFMGKSESSERRENKFSDGVKWFEEFEAAKKFLMSQITSAMSIHQKRLAIAKDMLFETALLTEVVCK